MPSTVMSSPKIWVIGAINRVLSPVSVPVPEIFPPAKINVVLWAKVICPLITTSEFLPVSVVVGTTT